MIRQSPLFIPSRRGVLASLAAASLVPRSAKAFSPAQRKFVFVLASGGWDPTRVFADGTASGIVATESGAVPRETNGLRWVHAETRPSVAAWFERYSSQAAIVNGLLVPSIAHEQCITLALTGTTGDSGSDWPSILGMAAMDRCAAPNLVLAGPSFPGINLPAVVQTGARGQLGDLITGGYREWGERSAPVLSAAGRSTLDAHLDARAAGFASAAGSERSRAQAQAYILAMQQRAKLSSLPAGFSFSPYASLDDAIAVGTEALSSGVSRVLSLSSPLSGDLGWDSHSTNDDLQNVLFEAFFASMLTLFQRLESLPGESAPTLLEETTVLLYSEMGRTPWLNAGTGKDHWPYTSLLLAGSGIRGGTNVGGFDDGWSGVPTNLATGEEDPTATRISCGDLGATLLALGDIDPGEWVPSSTPISALLA